MPISGKPQEALITATFSQRMRLRLADNQEFAGRLKGKKIRPVCGDRVMAHPIPDEPDWLITEILPRSNELTRPDRRSHVEVLAANVSLLAVVVAAAPAPDWFIVDRYLAAAEFMNASAVVIFNKADLPSALATSAPVLDEYRHAGYTVISCSAATGENLNDLHECFSGQTVIIVGQSGVGKSTLINTLVQSADQATAALSTSSGEGQHTTVNSVMWSLPGGGAVIDSPGVRDFAPAIDRPERVAATYREIANLAQHCRFANCRHLREPNCAVKSAVDSGDISARRYESYRRLLALAQKLSENHPQNTTR